MAAHLNKIRNPDFMAGRVEPRAWMWHSTTRRARWFRPSTPPNVRTPGVVIESTAAKGEGCWGQAVMCKPGTYYLVAVRVSCDLVAADETSGFVLQVGVREGNLAPAKAAGDETGGSFHTTPALHRSLQPTEVRAYFEVPPRQRHVEVWVGLNNAKGRVHIHEVRFISIVEPDEESHILAIPPHPWTLAARPTVRSVCVCSASAGERTVTRVLEGCFGERNVVRVKPSELREERVNTDALLILDANPPAGVRTMKALEQLTDQRIVVISLPAFSELAEGRAVLRRIEQPDDPIHAKLIFAGWHSRGFALSDTFAYSWRGDDGVSFVQNQFRKTPALKAFCERHGLVTMLASMCAQDATSNHPVSLFKPTEGGCLFVLDLEPIEARASSYGEPSLAVHLLLSILGQEQCQLGQYVVPDRTEVAFRERIREMGRRFPAWTIQEEDLPGGEVAEQLVTIGGDDRSYGLSLASKPLILVRSGLASGDAESVYGALLWFKQLVRMPPYTCPYADALASRYRLAWLPSAAPWERRDGFLRTESPPRRPLELEGEQGTLAGLVDVVSRPINRVRLVVPTAEGPYRHHVHWLSQLAAAFPAGCYFGQSVDDGDGFADREAYAWRWMRHGLQVVVEPKAFEDRIHRSILDCGGLALRLEIPGSDYDFVAHSIARTDLTATLLEQTIGLFCGLIAVNRRTVPVVFNGFPPVGAGSAVILNRSHPSLAAWEAQAG